jgi:hypothetical protein
MEDFIERHVAYLEGHTCGTLHAFTWSSYYIWAYPWRATCGDTSCYSWRCIFYYFMEFWHGQNPNSPLSPWICLVGDCPLAILGFDYIHFLWSSSIYLASCTFIHGVGCLGIHTCGLVACILWTTCYFWRLVMEHSPRRNILLFYLSCTLEGALCELF